jgi:hypothetical protein
MTRRAVLFEGSDRKMPDGLVKIMIWGAILFFFGAMLMGWIYG